MDDAGEGYGRAGVVRSALAGVVTETKVVLKELSGDDTTVIEAVRHPDNFEAYLRRRTANRRQDVEAIVESFFDNLTRIVADEFIYRAPGSRALGIAALEQLLARQKQLLAGQEQPLDGQAETNERLTEAATDIQEIRRAVTRNQPALPTRIHPDGHPRAAVDFVRREGQDELFDAIFTHAELHMTLTGMRGYGKTQLATAAATRCEEEGWPLVTRINTAPRKELIAGLCEFTLRTGISAPEEVPPGTIIHRLLNRLHSADVADCLFVFDNVENLGSLRDPTPEGSGIQAIITTTRRLDRDNRERYLVTVSVLERDQSVTILCEHSGDAHREAADQIVEALGNLPVTVTQTAATARWSGYALSDYLNRLNNHLFESSISRLEGDDYPNAVGITLFTAYKQALEQVRPKHPQQERIAISFLDALSLLAASGVSTHWPLGLGDDSDTVRVTLSFLKRSSILQESIDGSKTIIHRLQGQVYRGTYLSEHGKFNKACAYTTTTLDKIDIDQLVSFEQRRQRTRSLVKQIGAVTPQDHFHPSLSDPDFVALLAATTRNVVDLGMPQLALALTDSATRMGDILDPAHPNTLTLCNSLVGTYYDAGRLDEAITLRRQIFEDHTHIPGPHHPDTLTSRSNLVSVYQDVGRFDEVVTLYKQTLEDRIRILGPRHPDTLTLRNNLASAYQDAGRLNKAITLYEQTLEDHTRILGPHRPSTLISYNNLTSVYQAASRLDDTITLHKQSLKDRIRILEPHHSDTLASRSSLASVYQTTGRFDDAITLCKQNLKDRTRILGPHHPGILTSRNNLADAYQAVGRLDDAITLHEQTLTDSTRILGPNHPDTLALRNNLADTYQAVGRPDDAITLHKQSLEDSAHILGPHHPDTFTSHNSLANAYRDTGRLDNAVTPHKQSLKDPTHILGPHHPCTLISCDNLANAYRNTGRLDEVITLRKRNFEDCIRIPGPNHPHTPTLRSNLADVYRAAGRIEEVEKLFETPSGSEDEQDDTRRDQGQETED